MKLSLLAILVLLSSCNQKQQEVYSVKPTTGEKHHAVIKILMPGGGGGCTAFVISNRRAITAGHCVSVSKGFLKNKEEAVLSARIFIANTIREIEPVDCDNMPMSKLECLTIKKNAWSAIDRANKFIAQVNSNTPDTFQVFNSEGKEVKTKVIALDHELGYRDFAVLSGDFSQFEKLPVAKTFNVLPGELLRTCGYASLKTPAVCSNFIALGNSGFAYKGNGYLVKGMSGGPVVNGAGEVVGINVAVSRDEVLITPTIGLFDTIVHEED
jgi:hypothetical protein